MRKACRISRQFKLGDISIKPWGNRVSRTFCSARGPLPWESPSKFINQPQKQFRKKEEPCSNEPVYEKSCECECETLQRPKRNTYEWVVEEEEKPCNPFTVRAIADKTICELRRFKNCMNIFGDECKCQDLAPDYSKIRKIYPMNEIFEKGSLPGCPIPLPKSRN